MHATMKNPSRSHWINVGIERGRDEELFPIVTVTDVPRAGTVDVKLRASRYTSSDGAWTPWNVYITEITPSAGIGDVTEEKLREACLPLVAAWLDSDAYEPARRRALAQAIARIIKDDGARYGLERSRKIVSTLADELGPEQVEKFTAALGHLAAAADLLNV